MYFFIAAQDPNPEEVPRPHTKKISISQIVCHDIGVTQDPGCPSNTVQALFLHCCPDYLLLSVLTPSLHCKRLSDVCQIKLPGQCQWAGQLGQSGVWCIKLLHQTPGWQHRHTVSNGLVNLGYLGRIKQIYSDIYAK